MDQKALFNSITIHLRLQFSTLNSFIQNLPRKKILSAAKTIEIEHGNLLMISFGILTLKVQFYSPF